MEVSEEGVSGVKGNMHPLQETTGYENKSAATEEGKLKCAPDDHCDDSNRLVFYSLAKH